jgi:rSAM/selenodomain-associated transferase 2
MRVSIIVPVLNEAVSMADFLRHLRASAPAAEILVVDGGSIDASASIAQTLADRCLTSLPGRALQMNIGAAQASGDVLWFVHADSTVAPGSSEAMEAALRDDTVVGGCFRLRIISPRWVYRIRDAIGNLMVDLSGIALGDRGLFCRRTTFQQCGGYPQTSLLEDAEFYRRIKNYGRVVQLQVTIGTSARRYEKLGPVTTMLFYAFIMILYAMQVPMHILERMVRGYMRKRGMPTAPAKSALSPWEGRPGLVPK